MNFTYDSAVLRIDGEIARKPLKCILLFYVFFILCCATSHMFYPIFAFCMIHLHKVEY